MVVAVVVPPRLIQLCNSISRISASISSTAELITRWLFLNANQSRFCFILFRFIVFSVICQNSIIWLLNKTAHHSNCLISSRFQPSSCRLSAAVAARPVSQLVSNIKLTDCFPDSIALVQWVVESRMESSRDQINHEQQQQWKRRRKRPFNSSVNGIPRGLHNMREYGIPTWTLIEIYLCCSPKPNLTCFSFYHLSDICSRLSGDSGRRMDGSLWRNGEKNYNRTWSVEQLVHETIVHPWVT